MSDFIKNKEIFNKYLFEIKVLFKKKNIIFEDFVKNSQGGYENLKTNECKILYYQKNTLFEEFLFPLRHDFSDDNILEEKMTKLIIKVEDDDEFY